MPAYNFKAQFADQVKALEKCQTIRARGKRRPPRVGEPLMLYTGMRTQYCRKLADVFCTSVEPISISFNSRMVQMSVLRGRVPMWDILLDHELEALAKADGFDSVESFFAWFAETHGDTFSGYVIRW